MPTARRPARAAAKKSRKRADTAVLVLRKLRLLFNTIKGHFREVEKKAGIAGAQVWALSVIQASPGAGVTDLARAMDVHQSTASNLLKPLIEKGMVVADRAKDDRRALKLRITARGTAVLRKAPGPVTGVLPELLSRLDAATLERLDEDLEAVMALLKADKRAAKTPLGQPD